MPEPVHVVALSGCYTLEETVRYACEFNAQDPTTDSVIRWLRPYGFSPSRRDVAPIVAAWREARGLRNVAADAQLEEELSRQAPPAAAPADTTSDEDKPAGTFGFYLTAVLALVVSVDTSWRYFEHELGIANLAERVVMFAVLEVALIACGYGMRANVIRDGRPGAPRLFAWLLCGLAGYMAWQLSGLATGIARVALGPVLGLVMLHLALGIEVRARRGTSTTTWARLGRELRERVLSLFGLGDDERDALSHTRERAARRVVRLSLGTLVLFRSARVARALRKSNVPHDDEARERMLTELATIRHAADLADLDQPSPWTAAPAPANSSVATVVDTAVNTAPDGAPNGAPDSVPNGAVDGSVNGGESAAGTRPVASRGRSGDRPRGRSTGRRSGARNPTARRPLADYVTAASEHLTEDTEVTPAWVRSVVPDVPRSTSKNVADALKADREQVREQGTPEEDA